MGRRELLRVTAKVEVEFRSFEQFYREYTANLSKGGMFIQTDNVLKLQTVLEINLRLPDRDQPISVVGEVVHAIDPESAKQNGWTAGLGVQFVDFDDSARAALEEYVAKRFTREADTRLPDRRNAQRVNLRLRVKFPSLEVLEHDYSQDISRGGIFIHSRKPKAVGDKLILTLVHPKSGKELELLGEVVRVTTADSPGQDSAMGMGIRFLEMTKDKHKAIDDFLGLGVPVDRL